MQLEVVRPVMGTYLWLLHVPTTISIRLLFVVVVTCLHLLIAAVSPAPSETIMHPCRWFLVPTRVMTLGVARTDCDIRVLMVTLGSDPRNVVDVFMAMELLTMEMLLLPRAPLTVVPVLLWCPCLLLVCPPVLVVVPVLTPCRCLPPVSVSRPPLSTTRARAPVGVRVIFTKNLTMTSIIIDMAMITCTALVTWESWDVMIGVLRGEGRGVAREHGRANLMPPRRALHMLCVWVSLICCGVECRVIAWWGVDPLCPDPTYLVIGPLITYYDIVATMRSSSNASVRIIYNLSLWQLGSTSRSSRHNG